MKLVFGSRAKLDGLQKREVPAELTKNRMKDAQRDVWEEIVGKEKPGDPMKGGPYQRIVDAIMRGDLYPPQVALTVVDRTPLQTGDTVGILYRVLPGINVFYGIRIVHCFAESKDGTAKAGFTFHTLEGHPEMAEGTLNVEKDHKSGQLKVMFRTWSTPGHALAKLLFPFARAMQNATARASVQHLRGCAA